MESRLKYLVISIILNIVQLYYILMNEMTSFCYPILITNILILLI